MKVYVENGPRFLKEAPPGIDSMPDEVDFGFCECPVCGRGFSVAPRYPFFKPHIDGSSKLRSLWRSRNKWRRPKCPEVFWQWYDDFRSQMAEERPDIHFIPPGTSFGRLRLNVEHPLHLARSIGHSLIARADIADALVNRGIRLRVYPTIDGPRKGASGTDMDLELFSQEQPYRKSGHVFFELFAPAAAHLVLPDGVTLCERCQRCENTLLYHGTEPRPVIGQSVPADLDLFVSYERPGILMATERFVEATANLETDPWVKWKEIEVV